MTAVSPRFSGVYVDWVENPRRWFEVRDVNYEPVSAEQILKESLETGNQDILSLSADRAEINFYGYHFIKRDWKDKTVILTGEESRQFDETPPEDRPKLLQILLRGLLYYPEGLQVKPVTSLRQ
jgi:hypothetical protein